MLNLRVYLVMLRDGLQPFFTRTRNTQYIPISLKVVLCFWWDATKQHYPVGITEVDLKRQTERKPSKTYSISIGH